VINIILLSLRLTPKSNHIELLTQMITPYF